MSTPLNLALVVGGPSSERGISLNSGRSVADHLAGSDIAIGAVLYVDTRGESYLIDRGALYSNTPDDFDFKLAQDEPLSVEEIDRVLSGVDLVFPAIHGEFGEDGALQALLERVGVAYVGSGPEACETAFDKADAVGRMEKVGIAHVPTVVALATASAAGSTDLSTGSSGGLGESDWATVEGWLAEHRSVVIKPRRGGSSLGVVSASDRAGIEAHLATVTADQLIQPYLRGVEFTVVVLEGPDGPVAMPPVEIEIKARSEGSDQIFTYRHKYLSTNDSSYHCPPRFPDEVTDAIRRLACDVFTQFELRDFARIDGWLLDDGGLLISDINPISGMEQNSFLFIQSAEVGLSHAMVLRYVVANACRRAGLDAPSLVPPAVEAEGRRPVPVLFGGRTAERQVSLLSGSNVWMKLRESERYEPIPHLLRDGERLWRLPYAAALRHTVEEVDAYCRAALAEDGRFDPLRSSIRHDLGLDPSVVGENELPTEVLLVDLLDSTPIVFLGLHGGAGEDGTIQAMCEERGVAFNGPGSVTSDLCMDKYRTARAVAGLADEGIYTASQLLLEADLVGGSVGGADDEATADRETADGTVAELWSTIAQRCGPPPYIMKPIGDGCSAGVVPVGTRGDLALYLDAFGRREPRLSGSGFSLLDDTYVVEMPTEEGTRLMVEQGIQTDSIVVRSGSDGLPTRLVVGEKARTGWIEITVGVLGNAGSLKALTPSVTVTADRILSLEEKFMGGTGINLTPPPAPPLGQCRPEAVEAARTRIARIAETLGVEGYSRIDAFMQVDSGELILIEVNTLPGLTPSTVIYHQALAEDPPMPPRRFLEELLDLGIARRDRDSGGGAG